MSWRSVSRGAPCPACDKPDWCAWTEDGERLKCERSTVAPPGMRLLTEKDGGAVFVRDDGSERREAAPRKPRRAPKPARDWTALAKRYHAAIGDGRLDALASDLAVSPAALRALRCGWADEAELRGKWDGDFPAGAYTFPERDGKSRVVGISLRALDGRKSCAAGGKRGLIVPPKLDELADPVLIVEGASDVAALRSLGLAAVGRPSNAQGAEPLAELLRERDVLVVGERDEKPNGACPGRDGAIAVAKALRRAWSKPVRWTLPPDGEKDVRRWLEGRVAEGLDLGDEAACRAAGEELRGALREAAEMIEPPPAPLAWEPYPVDALPRSLRELASEGAAAIGCDPAYIALPALVVCAGAIGLSREALVRRGWREPSVLWGCVVGESGTAKSPALGLAEAPLTELEAAARRKHKRELAQWEEECAVLRAAAGKRGKPKLPDKPTCARSLSKDVTIEVLAPILAVNPRGVTVVRDELKAWFASWGEYKGGASGDAAKWLEIHGACALIVDRVTEGRSHYVARAAVSVVGGTQPGILRRVLSPEHLESGCAARIMFAFPPRRGRKWTEAEVGAETVARYERVVRALAGLSPGVVTYDDDETGIAPEPIALSAEARELFSGWVDGLGREALDHEGAAAAAAAKLEGGAARIALVLELAEAAEEGLAGDVSEIGAGAMAAGIRLARWHWRESRRVLAMLGAGEDEQEAPADRDRRRLAEWLARRGEDGATARDARQGCRWLRGDVGAAAAALDKLVEEGAAERLPGPRTARYRVRTAPPERHHYAPVPTVSVSGSAAGDSGEAASGDGDTGDRGQVVTLRKRWGAGSEGSR